ncbi:MAG TPA: ATP synthase F1 subunit delta [Polyangiaceae bacterium]
MSAETVADRYARAIFELGLENSDVTTLVEDMHKLAQAYQESDLLRKITGNPLVPQEECLAAVAEISERLQLSRLGKNAAGLLTRRKRLFALPAIAAELDRLSDEKAGIVRATVTSAEPLAEAYRNRLLQELQTMTGKKVMLVQKQEPELLAGLVIRIGDRVIDGSAKTRLSELVSQLLSA